MSKCTQTACAAIDCPCGCENCAHYIVRDDLRQGERERTRAWCEVHEEEVQAGQTTCDEFIRHY